MNRIPGPDGHPPVHPNASAARLYGAHQGGAEAKDAYPVDEQISQRIKALGIDPALIARQNRAFHNRAVRYLTAEAGIDQILDIGCGLPAQSGPNTHQIAQEVIPTAHVAYADNDPIVLAHAAALLTSGPQGTTTYVPADLTRPQELLEAARTHGGVNFRRPVGVLLIAVLHFLTDEQDPGQIVRTITAALPPGSAVVISHVTDDYNPAAMREAERLMSGGDVIARTRSKAEIRQFFAGLDLCHPGLVPVNQWPSTTAPDAQIPASDIHNYGGIGVKRADRGHTDGDPRARQSSTAR